MSPDLFACRGGLVLRILQDLTERYPYFVQRPGCTEKMGSTPHQKLITAVLRQLAFALPLDATNEYCRLGETTPQQNLENFCAEIQETHGAKYLRAPNDDHLKKILAENAA